MDNESVVENVREEFEPYLDDVLHRQENYAEIKRLVNLLSGEEAKVDLVDNSSRGHGYSEDWSSPRFSSVEDCDYVGYDLELDLEKKEDIIDFRTEILLVKEEDDEIKLVFPNEEVVGQRMIILL
jgi:hypothetical protein